MMKTTDEIYQEMREDYTRETGIVLSDSGDMALRLKAFAAQLNSLWAQAEWVKRQAFPQTARGMHLDYHAQLRGLSRGGATKAQGEVTFYINEAVSALLTIPAGTVCLAESGTEFITREADGIVSGELECTVQVAARFSGGLGNVPAGSVVRMAEAPVGILGCVNAKGFSGGREQESDEALRERIISSYRRLPNGANAAFYEAQALSVDGVSVAVVVPRARGIGTVDIIVAAETGMPTSGLVNKVAELLEAQREICVDLCVRAPEAISVEVSASIEIEKGHSFDAVSAKVRAALESHFGGERLGQDVLVAELGSIIFAVEGVRNYSLTMPAGDISMGDTQLPVLSPLTISKAGE